MSETLAFDDLVGEFHRVLGGLPDYRIGQNTTYSISHSAITPVVVAPGNSRVITLQPELIDW